MAQFIESLEWASFPFTNTISSTPLTHGQLLLVEDTVGMVFVAEKLTSQGCSDTLDIDWNEEGVLVYQCEKIRLPKAAVAIAPGQALYWSGTHGDPVTNVWASGLYRIGICVEDAEASDSEVLAHLEGHQVTAEAAP